MTPQASYDALDAWIDQHFDEEVRFLQALVRVPTDTPPGNNAPHADRAAELLKAMGLEAEKHVVPADEVKAAGLQTITNLIVRRKFGSAGKIARQLGKAGLMRHLSLGAQGIRANLQIVWGEFTGLSGRQINRRHVASAGCV